MTENELFDHLANFAKGKLCFVSRTTIVESGEEVCQVHSCLAMYPAESSFKMFSVEGFMSPQQIRSAALKLRIDPDTLARFRQNLNDSEHTLSCNLREILVQPGGLELIWDSANNFCSINNLPIFALFFGWGLNNRQPDVGLYTLAGLPPDFVLKRLQFAVQAWAATEN